LIPPLHWIRFYNKKIKPDDVYPRSPIEARSRPPRDPQQTQPIQFPACAEDFKLEIRFKNRANGILLKIFDTAPVYHLSHGIVLSSIQCLFMSVDL
jgi:hypothetical protein